MLYSVRYDQLYRPSPIPCSVLLLAAPISNSGPNAQHNGEINDSALCAATSSSGDKTVPIKEITSAWHVNKFALCGGCSAAQGSSEWWCCLVVAVLLFPAQTLWGGELPPHEDFCCFQARGAVCSHSICLHPPKLIFSLSQFIYSSGKKEPAKAEPSCLQPELSALTKPLGDRSYTGYALVMETLISSLLPPWGVRCVTSTRAGGYMLFTEACVSCASCDKAAASKMF